MDNKYRNQERRKQRIRQRKKKILIQYIQRMSVLLITAVFLTAAVIFIKNRIWPQDHKTGTVTEISTQGIDAELFEQHPKWKEDFLQINEYSRPGLSIEHVEKLYVHYTANPGSSAQQNRDYFNGLAQSKERYASAHFIIGYEGEIVQCVPLNEIAYAVKGENKHSISVECCHLEENGAFTQETYDSLIFLLKWLVEVYDLEMEDIARHYDSNGKLCPLYYVEHEDAWEQLKEDVFR